MTTSASNKEEKESGRQWLRKCSLLVGKGRDGLELGDLRIVFKTTKGDVETPNSAEINVYNLSEATSSKIRKEFTRVVLQAGYQDNCAVIFDGTIRQVRHFRENGTDVCTSILAADGDAAYNYAVVNTTLAAVPRLPNTSGRARRLSRERARIPGISRTWQARRSRAARSCTAWRANTCAIPRSRPARRGASRTARCR